MAETKNQTKTIAGAKRLYDAGIPFRKAINLTLQGKTSPNRVGNTRSGR